MELYLHKSVTTEKKAKQRKMHLLYFQIPNSLKPFMTNVNKQWTIMVRGFNYVDPHFKAFVCG